MISPVGFKSLSALLGMTLAFAIRSLEKTLKELLQHNLIHGVNHLNDFDLSQCYRRSSLWEFMSCY